MPTTEKSLFALDAAYKPFPPFAEWAKRAAVDERRWKHHFGALEELAGGVSAEVLEHARRVAARAAAIDTGAIEGLYESDRGFTYTVAFETAAWEAALNAKGERVRPLFEAQLKAYDYVLDFATGAQELSEAAIRRLHEEVCAAQQTYRVVTAVGPQEQPLPKGRYKIYPNHVRTRQGTDHSYAPVDVTGAEMMRLLEELRGEEFRAAHPAMQAAYAHYCLVAVHPFADGNGRVARALASAFTYRSHRVPIVILVESRERYLSSLEKADDGEFQVFVDFMLEQCLDTASLVEQSLRGGVAEPIQSTVKDIERLYLTQGGLSFEQVDAAGYALFDAVAAAFKRKTQEIKSQRIVAGHEIRHPAHYPTAPDQRLPLGGGRLLRVIARTAAPASAEASRSFGLAVPRDAAANDDIKLVTADSAAGPVAFRGRIEQATGRISAVLQLQIELFVDQQLSRIMTELEDRAAATIRQANP